MRKTPGYLDQTQNEKRSECLLALYQRHNIRKTDRSHSLFIYFCVPLSYDRPVNLLDIKSCDCTKISSEIRWKQWQCERMAGEWRSTRMRINLMKTNRQNWMNLRVGGWNGVKQKPDSDGFSGLLMAKGYESYSKKTNTPSKQSWWCKNQNMIVRTREKKGSNNAYFHLLFAVGYLDVKRQKIDRKW